MQAHHIPPHGWPLVLPPLSLLPLFFATTFSFSFEFIYLSCFPIPFPLFEFGTRRYEIPVDPCAMGFDMRAKCILHTS